MTPKQKLQKERAWFKFIITGMSKPVNIDYLTPYEEQYWKQILDIRKKLLFHFDSGSRLMGLNVPEHKCWCGRKAKYQQSHPVYTDIEWVCKKHKLIE